MTKKKTLQEFINEAKNVHGDTYDYSKSVYINTHTPLIIICKIHGEFNQEPNGHINRKSGCPMCCIIQRGISRRIGIDKFLEQATTIHKDTYDYSKVQYINSNTNIIIICKIHGDFLQTPGSHLSQKAGCLICGNIKNSINRRTPLIDFINKANLIHDNKYDYSKVEYINSSKNIIIICKIHGEFLQTPSSHIHQNAGCSKCSNQYSPTTEEFIISAKEIHGELYDYSKVMYKSSKENVILICQEHGEFRMTPHSHILRKSKCQRCQKKYQPTTEQYIEDVTKIHGDKYDYSKVDYIDCRTPIVIICKTHGKFTQLPYTHTANHGCPKCSSCYSKSQIKWLTFMSIYYNINIKHAENGDEYKISDTRFKADGYCEEINTIYEFHGDYWHGNPKIYKEDDTTYFGKKFGELYQKTIDREKLIKAKGYNLVVMWEYDWKRINNAIKTLQQKFKIF